MNGLPEGNYTFSIINSCGGTNPASITVSGYHILQNNVEVAYNCGSFNLQVNYLSNDTTNQKFWLQKLDPLTGQWLHPITNTPFPEGTTPNDSNSYRLVNTINNVNIIAFGTLRVIMAKDIFGNGAPLSSCVTPIKTFNFTGAPRIINAYALPCSNDLKSVVVIAEGQAPLTYDITTKDNQPYEFAAGSSNLFTQLSPGIYNFQVTDNCGNIVNRPLDLTSIPELSITRSTLCDGQNGQLAVPNFAYLNYQWWKGTAQSTILSTSNTLNFNPFSSVSNTGVYSVRIYSTQPDLCADQIITIEIPVNGATLNAGVGSTSEICGSNPSIDLFTKLTGNYQRNGVWEEITGSGMLIGNTWMPYQIPFGTYKFKYTVSGLCAQQSQAIVTINYNAPAAALVVSVLESGCSTGTLHLLASDVANAVFHWTGPNGFVSDDQNPVITGNAAQTNGTYFVTSTVANCSSIAVPVEVALQESQAFSIVPDCKGNEFQVEVFSKDNAAIPADATFDWTGPNQYTSTGNPITITGRDKGKYSVTITIPGSCPVSSEIEIGRTVCMIPAGLSPNGDGKNDVFDLSGFSVLNLKIFSRYGRIVYEQDNYTNQWHGQDYKNRDLPDATYYYYIKMQSGEARTGWVYVVN